MNTPVAVGAALGAACLFAAGTALQYRAAVDLRSDAGIDARSVAQVARRSLTSPLWLGGSLLLGAGLGLHALALHNGPLTFVQPLLVSGVLFTLPTSRLAGGPAVSGADMRWAAALVAALACFLLVATPASQHAFDIDTGPALIATISGVAAIALCVGGARRANPRSTAFLLGLAAGIADACSAALIKVVTDVGTGGLWAVVSGWQVYALIVVGATALLLSQLAYRAGPMVASLPAINTANPLASVIIGTVVFDETFRAGPTALGLEVVSLLAIFVATIALSRRSHELAVPAPVDRPDAVATTNP